MPPPLRPRARRAARYLRYLARPQAFLPASAVCRPRLTPHELRLLLDEPWYHDFTVLGLPTRQRSGMFGPNQRAKQGPLFDLIDRAVALARTERGTVTGVELFCADGFYANYAIRCGASSVLGIDLDAASLEHARVAARLLGHGQRLELRQADVFELTSQHEVGICAGGLYHLEDPARLLERLTSSVSVALVVQTVYSLANTSSDYFEAPAPGWSWGCRFSYSYLQEMISAAGWTAIASITNELPGNDRPEDRGSAYLLCVPSG